MTNATAPLVNVTDQMKPDYNLSSYPCSNIGLLMPFVNEYTWSIGARAVIYIVGLIWSFFAVSIIADVFMCSIERITSKTTTIRIPDASEESGVRELEVRVWNNTVANLSLLALGTSAPEIALSCIEIIGNNFTAGDLGPGTIVGSAAFNLLVIAGICVMAVPSPETRRIANMNVFFVTGFTCIFAYVWMALILVVISPDIIEIWEAVVTLVSFPVLILVAYIADKNFCMGKKREEEEGMVGFSLVSGEEGAVERAPEDKMKKLARELGHEIRDGDINEDDAARIAAAKLSEHQSHSRGWYRINATRMLSGGRKLVPAVMSNFQEACKELYDHIQLDPDTRKDADIAIKSKDHTAGGTKAVVEFTAAAVSVLENEGKVRIGLRRFGRKDIPCTVHVETINGTALADEDYKPLSEDVTFSKNEELRQIYIEIVDDFEWEPDEFFFVKMTVPKQQDGNHEHIACGNVSICQVTIINDDEPGKLEFAKPSLVVKESYYTARIPVNRINGCDGHVSVKWKSSDITAKEGIDYQGKEGMLLFDNQEIQKTIDIPLFESNKAERDECFSIELGECDGGAELGKIRKTIVTIVNDDEFNGIVSRLLNLTKANLESLQLESNTWVGQFREAMNVNGGDIDNATLLDYVLHFLTFGFKFFIAFVPPSKYGGGWPTFIISLGVIFLLTVIIGDMAGIFGCLVGIPPSITAITIVALGTSMPDTFASKTAALGEKTADSSVGNVNGSNSVNVYLGLGLPWTLASIYWAVQTENPDKRFHVPSGSLAFSVVVYAVCAIMALSLLVLRRFVPAFGNAELGGTRSLKIVSGVFLITLWFIYVLLSTLQATGVISSPF